VFIFDEILILCCNDICCRLPIITELFNLIIVILWLYKCTYLVSIILICGERINHIFWFNIYTLMSVRQVKWSQKITLIKKDNLE